MLSLFEHMEERRREERVKVTVPVTFFSDGKAFPASTIDISPHGVRILSDVFLPVKEKVKLSLWSARGTTFTFLFDTIWCKELPHFRKYEVGLRLINDNKRGQKSLRSFLDSYKRDPVMANPPQGPFQLSFFEIPSLQ